MAFDENNIKKNSGTVEDTERKAGAKHSQAHASIHLVFDKSLWGRSVW